MQEVGRPLGLRLKRELIDAKDGSVFIAAEAARRFGENWKILLEGRGYIPQASNILEFFRNDAQIQVDIEYHY